MDKPFAITLDIDSSLANHTGTWRSERPVYVDGLPPCNHACPAGEQVQGWLYAAEDGSYETAWRRLVADNPFPAVMGRVCYHPCETACNRAELDTAVGINSVERFLGDEAIRAGLAAAGAGRTDRPPSAGRGSRTHRTVRGVSPSAARTRGRDPRSRQRTRWDDALRHPDLPAAARRPRRGNRPAARSLGITLKLNTPRQRSRPNDARGHFDAAFLAIGAQLSHRAYVPAGQAARVLDALSVLGDAASGQRPQLGRTVVVYGGGNTAMDAARTARRLGADDAIVVYRRTQAQMPANPIELEEAVEEGVQLKWLRTITQVDDGRMTLEKMELDEHGKPQPTGELRRTRRRRGHPRPRAGRRPVVAGHGDGRPDHRRGRQVDATMMTGHPGVFAGGDLVPSARSVTVGIGHGKTAAGHIDRWLRRVAGRADVNGPGSGARQPVAFGAMNAWYYSDAPHAMRPRLDAARRTADFAEVVGGLDADTALYEARRCMSCGNCFGCDNCFGVCPDNAVASRSTTPTATPSTTTTARAADSARPSARAEPSSWSPNAPDRAGDGTGLRSRTRRAVRPSPDRAGPSSLKL